MSPCLSSLKFQAVKYGFFFKHPDWLQGMNTPGKLGEKNIQGFSAGKGDIFFLFNNLRYDLTQVEIPQHGFPNHSDSLCFVLKAKYPQSIMGIR